MPNSESDNRSQFLRPSPVNPLLPAGTAIAVFGQSRCGKSTFLRELVRHADRLLSTPPTRIEIYSRVEQAQYASLRDERVAGVWEHFPLDLHNQPPDHLLVIIDDAMCALTTEERNALHRYVTGLCHHAQITLAVSLQQIYERNLRTIRLQFEYHVLFACNTDRSTMQTLGRQLYPNKSKEFYAAYADATREPYGYLVYCAAPHAPDRYRLRARLTDYASIVYDV